MSKSSATLLLLVVEAVLPPAVAHESDACLVAEDLNTPVCHHYFEDRRVELPVRDVLDSIDADCEKLVGLVLQRQGLLLVQLGEPIKLDARTCATMTNIALDLPDVRSETDLLVTFAHLLPNDRQLDQSNTAATIALRVYPDTLLEPLSKLAERRALVILGDDEELSAFFDANGIDYTQDFRALTAPPVGLLVRPARPEQMLDDRGIGTAIIFREKIVDLPQVRTVSTGGRTRVYVEMPLLHDLRESPLVQKALLNIFRLAIDPNSVDRG